MAWRSADSFSAGSLAGRARISRVSSACDSLARTAAIPRVTSAVRRAGSSALGSFQTRAGGPGLFVAQVFEVDAKGLPVGELGVVLALEGEVGIELDAVTDVAMTRNGGQPSSVGSRG